MTKAFTGTEARRSPGSRIRQATFCPCCRMASDSNQYETQPTRGEVTMATNPRQAGAVTARDERTQPRTQKITTFLWFDNNAEKAVNFYVSIFKNSKVLNATRYGDAGPGPKGTVMIIAF